MKKHLATLLTVLALAASTSVPVFAQSIYSPALNGGGSTGYNHLMKQEAKSG